jgi:hypothetical protein
MVLGDFMAFSFCSILMCRNLPSSHRRNLETRSSEGLGAELIAKDRPLALE